MLYYGVVSRFKRNSIMINLKLLLVFSLLCISCIFAQEDSFEIEKVHSAMGTQTVVVDGIDSTLVVSEAPESIGVLLLRIAGSLSLVLFLIVAILFVIKKLGLFRGERNLQSPSLQILESLSVGQGGVIMLIRCENSVHLVGQTASQFSLIQTFPSVTAAQIIDERQGSETVGSFKTNLSQFMSNLTTPQSVSKESGRV